MLKARSSVRSRSAQSSRERLDEVTVDIDLSEFERVLGSSRRTGRLSDVLLKMLENYGVDVVALIENPVGVGGYVYAYPPEKEGELLEVNSRARDYYDLVYRLYRLYKPDAIVSAFSDTASVVALVKFRENR
jgi:hypothetical protein